MEIVDANVIIRYLLNDHVTFSKESISILENNEVHVPFEVLAEVVYVLEKVYKISRQHIFHALTILIEYPNIQTNDKTVFIKAIETYHIQNIDFVDAILIAYNQVTNAKIYTFDKKLLKLCR